jgi:D-alanyl-D-alanine dipeptidase
MRRFSLLLSLFAFACNSDVSVAQQPDQPTATDAQRSKDAIEKTIETAAPAPTAPQPVNHNGFSDIAQLEPGIRLDIRYATTDNFTQSKIYDCPRCLLRPEAAEAVVKAHKILKKKGLGLKMFDCYRPRPYQQRLWDKVPNPDYVTPPAKGSMHSRGAAVDLTIVDQQGRELDMGTAYDFFGREAHTDNMNLPAKVLENRRLLRETMEAVGFKGIRTEWWHFSYQSKQWPLSDYVWPCN